MAFGSSKTASTKKPRVNKLVLGFAALAATAVVGTTGIVAAQANNGKPTKEQCSAAGYPNYGQCVREWARNKGGSGYGGQGGGDTGNTSNTVNANVDLKVEGDNNIISIIINFFR